MLLRPSSYNLSKRIITPSSYIWPALHSSMSRILAHPRVDDFVDDSEPERVELRKKQRKGEFKSVISPEKGTGAWTSNDLPTLSGPRRSKYDQDVIEISDDSEIEVIYAPQLNVVESDVGRRIFEGTKISIPVLSQGTVGSEHRQDDSSHKQFDLNRFAFEPPPPTRRGAIPIAPPRNTRTNLAPKKSVPLDIALSDLAKISRCVCCDLSWTARKTSVQKMAHIRNCAKRYSLSENTVNVLIQKEVANFAPLPSVKKGKEKELPPVDSPVTKTYMEDVLGGIAPRKKAKLKDVLSRVASISETRADTLSRAKLLFSSSPDPTDCESNVAPSTQPFGHSVLGQLQASSKGLFFASSPSPAYHQDISSPVILVKEHDCTNSDTIEDMRDGSTLSIGSAEDPRLPDSPSSHGDCFMIYEQEVASPRKKLQGRTVQRENTPIPMKDARAKAQTSKKGSKVIFGDEWESHMMEHIKRDVNLHLRILRYEPIDFNVFLGLAQIYAPINGILKLQLRKYLDKKAIHFYEASRV